MQKRSLLRHLLAGALAALCAAPVLAGPWPERPIKLIVPYPAGGLTDIVSRLVGDELGRELGTSVVIENRAGAGGMAAAVARIAMGPLDRHTGILTLTLSQGAGTTLSLRTQIRFGGGLM